MSKRDLERKEDRKGAQTYARDDLPSPMGLAFVVDDSWLGPVVSTTTGLPGIVADSKDTKKAAEARHTGASDVRLIGTLYRTAATAFIFV